MMLLSRVIASIVLLTHLIQSSTASLSMGSSPFLAKKRRLPVTTETAMMIRGGGGIDKTTVAHIATGVSLVHGTLTYLTPESTCEVYGVKVTRVAKIFMRRVGLSILNLGMLGYSLISKDLSVKQTVSLVSLSWVIEFVSSILNKEFKSDELLPQYIVLGITAAFLTALRSSQSALVMKLYAIFIGLVGLQLAAMPDAASDVWKVPKLEPAERAMSMDLGFWLVAVAVFHGCLAWDMPAMQSLSYSRLVILLRTVTLNFVTKDFGKIGMKKPGQILWMIYHVLVVLGLFIKGD